MTAATAATSQQLWTSGAALVQRAQEPNIPCGESLTSISGPLTIFLSTQAGARGAPAPCRHHTWASPWRGTFGTPTPLELSRSISLNSGRHSGQETVFRSFPMVFDSWWEISENGDRGFAQNFDARLMSIVVCPGEPFLEKLFRIRKYALFENVYVPKIQKSSFFRDKSPAGCDQT